MKVALQLVTMVALVSATLFYTYNTTETEKDSGETRDSDDLLNGYSAIDLLEKEIKTVERKQQEVELVKLRSKKRKEIEKKEARRRVEVATSRGAKRKVFTATAYDLTVASCGKSESHPQYGITANGTSLKGHTLESIRAIAVDPKVIKLGSKVYIEFIDENWKHLNGEFTAVDTGSAIKGNIVDIFFGDTGDSKTDQKVWDFGRRKIELTVISRP